MKKSHIIFRKSEQKFFLDETNHKKITYTRYVQYLQFNKHN